jgi:hypothetical protein
MSDFIINKIYICVISCSYVGDCEDDCFLGHSALQSIELDRRFRSAYCILHQSDGEGGSTHL